MTFWRTWPKRPPTYHRQGWRDRPATAGQLRVLLDHGIDPPPDCTQRQAEALLVERGVILRPKWRP